jgi:hypothetical protein
MSFALLGAPAVLDHTEEIKPYTIFIGILLVITSFLY